MYLTPCLAVNDITTPCYGQGGNSARAKKSPSEYSGYVGDSAEFCRFQDPHCF